MAEVLTHNGEKLLILGDRERRFTVSAQDGSSAEHILPRSARVFFMEHPAGLTDGITRSVMQEPPVCIGDRRNERGQSKAPRNIFDQSFLGLAGEVLPDGTCNPPELRDQLVYARDTLGWDIDQPIVEVLHLSPSEPVISALAVLPLSGQ
ncbi:MAG: hypothetical protein Q8Q49_02310 [bacterium]|nr:hypothetical protein [bacterium]